MKTQLQYLFSTLLIGLLVFPQGVQGQCTGGVNSGSIAPTLAAQTIGCIQGGQYYTFTGVAGTSYLFSFCTNGGSATFDTQITILDALGNPVAGAYNDDFCGLQSELIFTPATTGTYQVLVNQYFCNTNGTCATLSYQQQAPIGPGQNCGNPFVIPALPFNSTGMTTCGYGDNYSSADACGSVYMNGDDFVFTYTSLGNESITINLTNTGTYTGIFVMDGCPNAVGTNCVPLNGGGTNCAGGGAATNEAFGGNPFGTWDLVAPGTYYFVVSTFPAPQCTGFDISVSSAAISGGGGAGLGCYTVNTSIPYSPDPFNQGTTVVFPDDEFSGLLPIGFQFCFMGTPYNSFVVSSNGYITFNNTCAGQYSPYVTVPIAAPAQPEIHNSILGFWQDIDPSVGGNLRYRVLGVAPNRRLNVNFDQIPMFSAACNSQLFTGQITLYETTNNIDIYIQNKPLCTSWNGGNAVQGLLDATGTVAVTVGGRNNTNWAVNNDAVRFTPTCDVCQVILDANYRSLSGLPTNTGNFVQWETSSEDDLSLFELQRSQDGQTFGTVGSQAALGNATQGAQYEMLDVQPFHPLTYYRLRELSQNGEVSYSEVVQVQSELVSTPVTNAYVDVASNELVVDFQAAEALGTLRLDIVDGLGRVQIRTRIALDRGVSQMRIPVNQLSAGYYFLQVNGASSVRDTRKFVLY